jgi:hypothetical protein
MVAAGVSCPKPSLPAERLVISTHQLVGDGRIGLKGKSNMLRLRFGPVLAIVGTLLLAACSSAAPAAAPGATAEPGFVSNPGVEDGRDLGGEKPGDAPQPTDQSLIVYSGSLSMDVADVDRAIADGQQLITGLGGYVAQSSIRNSGSDVSADVTYRIPAASWDEALAGLHQLADRVTDEEVGTEDVTAQVVDLDARLANARATEAALQAIMDRAQTITDVLKVQQELTNIRGDIESMSAQRDYLANRAAFGTLEVSFNAPLTAQAVAAEGWDLGREIDASLAALVRIGQWLASIAVWLVIVVLPVLLPLLVLAWIGMRLRRRWLASRPRPAETNEAG